MTIAQIVTHGIGPGGSPAGIVLDGFVSRAAPVPTAAGVGFVIPILAGKQRIFSFSPYAWYTAITASSTAPLYLLPGDANYKPLSLWGGLTAIVAATTAPAPVQMTTIPDLKPNNILITNSSVIDAFLVVAGTAADATALAAAGIPTP